MKTIKSINPPGPHLINTAFSVLAVAVFLLSGAESAPNTMKRSDDPDPLIAMVQQLSAKIANLEARQSADEARLTSLEHHVAFKVTFSASTLRPPGTGPYKFDTVVFNDGNAYDPVLGVFTAPYSGVYIFSFQIFTHLAERPTIDIKVNGNVAARMAVDTTNETPQSDSTTLTVKLSHGDRVWAEAGDSSAIDVYGPNHTFFSGALLYTA